MMGCQERNGDHHHAVLTPKKWSSLLCCVATKGIVFVAVLCWQQRKSFCCSAVLAAKKFFIAMLCYQQRNGHHAIRYIQKIHCFIMLGNMAVSMATKKRQEKHHRTLSYGRNNEMLDKNKSPNRPQQDAWQ